MLICTWIKTKADDKEMNNKLFKTSSKAYKNRGAEVFNQDAVSALIWRVDF